MKTKPIKYAFAAALALSPTVGSLIYIYKSSVESAARHEETQKQIKESEALIARLDAKSAAWKKEIEQAKNYEKLPVLGKALLDISTFGRDSTYVVLGDTDHGNTSIRYFIRDAGLMPGLAAQGFKYIATEDTLSMQPVINALADGRISKRTFVTVNEIIYGAKNVDEYETWIKGKNHVRESEQFADSIVAAKASGIKIIAANGLEGCSLEAKTALAGQTRRYMDFANFIEKNLDIYTESRADFAFKFLYKREVYTNGIVKKQNEREEVEFKKRQATGNDNYGMIQTVIEEDPAIISQNILTGQELRNILAQKDFYAYAASIYQSWKTGYSYEHADIAYNPFCDADASFQAQLNRRMKEDGNVAHRIRHLTKNEKTLVIYGAAHSEGDNSLAADLKAPVLKIYETSSGIRLFPAVNSLQASRAPSASPS